MTKKLLHDPNIGTVRQHVRRATVAKDVRTDGLAVDSGRERASFDNEIDTLAGEGPTTLVEKQSGGRSGHRELAAAARREIVAKCAFQRTAHGHETLLGSLSGDPNKALIEVKVRNGESGDLTYSGSRAVQQLEQRGVAKANGGVVIERVEEVQDHRFLERFGERSPSSRRGNTLRRVDREELLIDEEAAPPSEGGGGPRD